MCHVRGLAVEGTGYAEAGRLKEQREDAEVPRN